MPEDKNVKTAKRASIALYLLGGVFVPQILISGLVGALMSYAGKKIGKSLYWNKVDKGFNNTFNSSNVNVNGLENVVYVGDAKYTQSFGGSDETVTYVNGKPMTVKRFRDEEEPITTFMLHFYNNNPGRSPVSVDDLRTVVNSVDDLPDKRGILENFDSIIDYLVNEDVLKRDPADASLVMPSNNFSNSDYLKRRYVLNENAQGNTVISFLGSQNNTFSSLCDADINITVPTPWLGRTVTPQNSTALKSALNGVESVIISDRNGHSVVPPASIPHGSRVFLTPGQLRAADYFIKNPEN